MYRELRPEDLTTLCQSLDHVVEASFRSLRGLFLLNGGGCAVLISLLGSFVGEEQSLQSARTGVAYGGAAMAVGVAAAALAQYLRYQCRLSYYRGGAPLYPFQKNKLDECVDIKEIDRGNVLHLATTIVAGLSLLCFLAGVGFVFLYLT